MADDPGLHKVVEANAPEVRQVGGHRVEIEGDLLITRIVGDYTLEDIRSYYELAREMSQKGDVYSIGDMTRAGTITPEARRYSVENGNGLRMIYSASFGLNPAMRVLMTMLLRAAQLLGRSRPGTQVEFFATEAEARAAVARIRARTRGESARSRNSLPGR